jgi:hypothetical protein
MSISQNFPDEGPSLNLNFASSRTLDPRITFTRTSTGTYTNKNGLVTIAPTDTPRFDHSYDGSNVQSLGLLIEESRTNLITYSEQFNDASWTKGNIGIATNTSATTAPDGTTTAEKLVENTASNVEHSAYVSRTGSNETVTFSVFAKAAERGYIALQLSNFLNAAAQVVFNLSNGAVVSTGSTNADYTAISATTISYPNGWYRCILTATKGTVNTTNIPNIIIHNGSTTIYTGDGTSGIYIWGAQLETGAFPTSYIPTAGSQVTRSADNASMTGTNFSSWYNSSEGSVVTNIKYDGAPISGTTNRTGYVLYNATNGNMRQIWWEGTNTGAFLGENPAGSYVIVTNVAQTITQGSTNKIATAYKLNDFPITQNGGTIATDTSGTPPVTTSLFIGNFAGSYDWVNGRVAQLLYYPKRLTNSQLQNLTK